MALLTLDFESQYLGFNTNVNIIVPDKPRELTPEQFYGNGEKYRVLWLLHGTFGGYSDWIRKSNIELYACEHNLIVVMPGIGNTDYSAWDSFTLGYDSDQYIVKELMPLVYNWLPASSKREDNYVAGLSMGGEGALHFALKYSQLFEAAAILSYIPFDYRSEREQLDELFDKKPEDVYGNKTDVMHSEQRQYNILHKYPSVDAFLASEENLYEVMDRTDTSNMPRLFFACGTDDPLFADSIESYRNHLKEENIPAVFSTGPGSHEWRVWERDIQKALDFFGFNKENKGNAF
jgi:putative tributyrin esterase